MIEGSLRDLPLAEVVQVVIAGRKGGVLRVERGSRHAQLWFDQGRLQAASLDGGPHLGEALVRLDLLGVDEVQTLLAAQAAAGGQPALGAAAVARGWIDAADLSRALEHHLIDVLGELMAWRDGRFAFTEGGGAPGDPDGPRFDAMRVLMRAEEARAGTLRIEPDAVLRRVGDPTDRELEPEAWEVMGLVDGRRSAQALAAETDLPPGRTFGLLADLAEAGLLERVGDAVSPPTVLVVCADAAERRLLRLTLLRQGVRPHLVADLERADAIFADLRPSAVVVDAGLAPWAWLRGLRRRVEGSHVPVLMIGEEAGPWWSRWRGGSGERLARPYREADLQAWLAQRIPGGLR